VSTLTRIDWLEPCRPGRLALGRDFLRAGLGRGLLRSLGGHRCGGRRHERRRGHLGFGLAEGALQFVQRHLARTQFALQRLRHEGALRHLLGGRRRRLGCAELHHALQRVDQVAVVAFGLGLGRLELAQDVLDAVDGVEDQRHGLAGHRHAVAEFAHQRFGRVRERFKPRQAEEAAGALDRVNKAENVVENFCVVRFLLETHQLVVDGIEALVGLSQEFPQQIVHETNLHAKNGMRGMPFGIGAVSSQSV